jgi:LmbE family N-acetylglucosaminyl deacetylase
MRTILGIWAHPDDEVFTSAGVMADAVAHGDRVVCLHMTRGEAGLYHRDPYSPERLAVVREGELEAALECLGVTEQRFFDFPDGRLAMIPSEEAIARLHDALVRIEPDVILTFGADGFTGHPDHRILSRWVTTAIRVWNRPRARVLHAAVPQQWPESVVPRLNEFDFFWPGHPQVSPRGDVIVRLDEHALALKIDALRAHASQMEPLFDAYGEEFLRTVAATEVFRSGPRPAFRSRVLSDLSGRSI